MCTVFTHAVVAVVGGAALGPRGAPFRFWPIAILCSAGPDLDVLLHGFGVHYADPWGHRGMTHSLAAAAVVAVAVSALFFRSYAPLLRARWWWLAAVLFVLGASHGFLDAFTDGGLGIAFLAPFDGTRYFMPVRPILVAPIGVSGLFTEYGAAVLGSEIRWVWAPVAAAGGLVILMRALRRRGSRPA